MEEVFLRVAHGETADSAPSTAPALASNPLHSPSSPTSQREVEMTVLPGSGGSSGGGGNGGGGSIAGKAVGKQGMQAVRGMARVELSPWTAFLAHFRALFLKRLAVSRRDQRALLYQLFLPVIMVAGGLALLKSAIPSGYPDFQFSTAYMNAVRPRAFVFLL
jgi:hypothetical protein